jgi:spermidine/putrescine transport system substrate-binding protein
MSDPKPTQIERAIARAFRPRRRMTRRAFLVDAGKGTAVAGGMLSLPSILAACGISPAGSASGTAAGSATPVPLPSSPAGLVNFENWPAYIDVTDATADKKVENQVHPTLRKFTRGTDIQVNYGEGINDNEEFFGKIQPDLAAGNDTGYDIIVLTDWMIQRMVSLGYLELLHHEELSNFEANADDLYRDPWYDPGNQHSLAWQSGITGIGWNKKLVAQLRPDKPEITTFDDLLDPAFEGQVGMFSDMRDTMSLTLLSLGITPVDATIDDVQAAHDKLLEPAERGQFQGFYGNDYYDLLAANNLALSIAWSGDISQMQLYDNGDVEYVIPATGGMRFVDNMCIPNKAEHPLDAHMLMNFWYDLDNAVPLTEWIGYFSPVSGVPERVLQDADQARQDGDEEWASALEVIAATATPSEEALANVYEYKVLDEDEEREWNNLFNEIAFG